MRKILQINTTVNWGSTGKIAEAIGRLSISEGWESWIGFGRGNSNSSSRLIKIGRKRDIIEHGLTTRLFDRHGLGSKQASTEFVDTISKLKPDLIQIHNIHGYYLNYPILFDFLKDYSCPVVWTLHDCWALTGHCTNFTFNACNRWINHCNHCPDMHSYPSSLFMENSYNNHMLKKKYFSGIKNMHIITCSEWLKKQVDNSFLSQYPVKTIHNGIDLSIFHCNNKNYGEKTPYILGVANVWTDRKGFKEFIKLRRLISKEINIYLVGLTGKQIKDLPEGIIGIKRTDNVQQLVSLYQNALAFVNPTFEDNFPTTNLEALACGTPVITYNTGGSPEAIDDKTGYVVECGNTIQLSDAIEEVYLKKPFLATNCRNRAELFYNQQSAFNEYIELYKTLLL